MPSATANIYFERYAWQQPLTNDWLPDPSTTLIIVLPAFNEPDVRTAITSLANCDPPSNPVVLLLLINESENAQEAIRKTNDRAFQQAMTIDSLPEWMTLKVHRVALPTKKAGVGLARKIGMDEAARWFHRLNKRGVIICFDADSTCSPNFLKQVEQHFIHENNKVAITYYEHPMNEASGIISYELHLRYYANALAYTGYPKPFQTLGSCISVDNHTYIQTGGMNTRKAGEDFYFLHKAALTHTITEINQATIYPSDRLSERVPFGTGRALLGYKDSSELLTYSMDAFLDLKDYFSLNTDTILSLEDLNIGRMQPFLSEQKFDDAFHKILQHSGGQKHRMQELFYNWWDGLRVLKYIHYCRDQGDEMINPAKAIHDLNHHYWKEKLPTDKVSLLKWMRAKDRH